MRFWNKYKSGVEIKMTPIMLKETIQPHTCLGYDAGSQKQFPHPLSP